MKKILLFPFIFILLFTFSLNFLAFSCFAASNNTSPTFHEKDQQKIKNLLERYYETCKKEDVEEYLSLMSIENKSQRDFLKNVAQITWQKTDTLDYSMNNLKIALSKDKKRAWAFYHIKGTVEYIKDKERRKMDFNYDCVAFFSKIKGEWKIDKIVPKPIFYENIIGTSFIEMFSEEISKTLSEVGEKMSKVKITNFKLVAIPESLAILKKKNEFTDKAEKIEAIFDFSGETGKSYKFLIVFSGPGEISYFISKNIPSQKKTFKATLPLCKFEKEKIKGNWKINLYVNNVGIYSASFKIIPASETKPSLVLGREKVKEDKRKLLEVIEKLKKEVKYLKDKINQLENKINSLEEKVFTKIFPESNF